MTIIQSLYAAGWTLTVTSEKAGQTRIKIRTARGETPSVAVSTAELHAALGIDELGCGCDEADTNLKKALARAEEAEAKLLRVWDLTADADPNDRFTKREIREALSPQPALPTEPGSIIFIDADVTQTRAGIPAACQRDGRFRALDGSAGGWDRDTITKWRPAKVVAA